MLAASLGPKVPPVGSPRNEGSEPSPYEQAWDGGACHQLKLEHVAAAVGCGAPYLSRPKRVRMTSWVTSIVVSASHSREDVYYRCIVACSWARSGQRG